MFRRIALLVVPTLIASGLTLTLPSSPANADTASILSLGSFRGNMVVDTAQSRIFLSGGTGIVSTAPAGLVVANLNGSSPVTVAGFSNVHPTGLALSPDGATLYVAVTDGIDSVDAAALTITHFYPTATPADPGSGLTESTNCPSSLAFAGGNIWFAYGCGSGDGGLGVLDLADGSVAGRVYKNIDHGTLLTDPVDSSKIVDSEGKSSSALLAVLTVSGTTATPDVQTSGESAGSDIAISPDGTRILSGGTEYFTSTLLPTGRVYGTGEHAAVAYSADGNFVAVGSPLYDPMLATYVAATGALVHTYVAKSIYGASGTLDIGAGVAWNGTTLIGVETDYLNETPTLVALTSAEQFPSTITLTGPETSVRTKPLSLTGTLTSNGAVLAHNTIHVTKKNMDGTGTLTSVVTDSAGHFTIHDSPGVGGAVTYTATSTADATHASASKSFTVTVSRTTPSVTISTDHTTYGYHATVHITGYLGKTYKNRTLTIYYTQYGHSKATLHANAKVDSKGHLTASFVGSLDTTVTVTFPGDEIYNTRSVSKKIYVAASESSAIAGYYKKSGSYYVFHQSDGGAIAAKISPNVVVPNRHVWFVMQVYKSGKWVSATANYEVFTDGSGIAGAVYDGKTGYHLRIRAEFHGDQANAPKTGGWWYIEFT